MEKERKEISDCFEMRLYRGSFFYSFSSLFCGHGDNVKRMIICAFYKPTNIANLV